METFLYNYNIMTEKTLLVYGFIKCMENLHVHNVIYNLDKYINNVIKYKIDCDKYNFCHKKVRNLQINNILNIIKSENIKTVWFYTTWAISYNFYKNGGNLIEYFDLNFFIENNIRLIITPFDTHRITEKFVAFVNSINYTNFCVTDHSTYEIVMYVTKMNIPRENFQQLPSVGNEYIDIPFNTNPINKILLSGCISNFYPERVKLLLWHQNNTNLSDYLSVINNLNYWTELNKYVASFATSVGSFGGCDKSTGCILIKHLEIPATGSLLLAHDCSKVALNIMGFCNMKNCIMFNDSNIDEIVKFILDENNKNVIDEIRLNGRNHVLNNYTEKHYIENIKLILQHH